MHISIGMTTAPRPEPYIGRAVTSLREAGFDRPVHFFAEPGSGFTGVDLPPDSVLWQSCTPLGCFPNWKWGLTVLADRAEPGDWIMLLQDDVIWRRDARKCLEDFLGCVPRTNLGFVSPYASVAMVSTRDKHDCAASPGQHWVPPSFHDSAFWGALALVFPVETARALLEFPRFRNHTHTRKVDVLVGNCLKDMGRELWIAVPSLCDHIGAVSTLGRHRIKGIQWGRRGYGFRPDWDD
jgi:hypothetical protein